MGPESLTLVRHGQSIANAVREAGAEEYSTGTRDADVPLSQLGREQSTAVGKRLAGEAFSYDAVHCSPYHRTRETARLALAEFTAPDPAGGRVRFDERLRDRETGLLFGLTKTGIGRRHPEELRMLERDGGFYYRPPGGENWPDVALRLRSLMTELTGHVLVFTHDIVVVLTRYLLAELDEEALRPFDSAQVANASVTRWERAGSGYRLTVDNDVSHLH